MILTSDDKFFLYSIIFQENYLFLQEHFWRCSLSDVALFVLYFTQISYTVRSGCCLKW
jgi:hypothetical protein